MVLRELRLRHDDLSASEQRTADVILARPTNSASKDEPLGVKYPPGTTVLHHCPGDVCIHWADPTPASPTLDPGDVTPQVELTTTTFEQVWDAVVRRLGYRAPLSDAHLPDSGPDGRLDVYMIDLPDSVYGFCSPETGESRRSTTGYCVVDDDYLEYAGSPADSLRVTAAHEFFHAVQFGYDWTEDVWFMEGTATWVEDEVYDAVNDNRQFLDSSALAHPDAPLDFVDDGGFPYGSWIFWRYLSESLGAGRSSDPAIVAQTWARAAGSRDSLRALRSALAARNRDLGATFAAFGAANLVAKRVYDEGASYRQSQPVRRFTLERSRRAVGPSTLRLDHLSNGSARLFPGRSLTGTWRLRLTLDLPPRVRGSRATITLHRRDGGLRRRTVAVDTRGNATVVVPFSRSAVSAVSLTLTNASTRMAHCDTDPFDDQYGSGWSCGGWSIDDRLPFVFTARAVR
jgi:hypothetical protein